jgi:hypothetical protein
MKKQIKSAFVFIITAVVLAGSQFAASAQTPQHLAVNVPFDFAVGDRQLPAGRYHIRRVNPDSESALLIESADGRARATVLTNAARGASARATLTFKRYGDRHFLAGVWLPGAAVGRTLQESKQERGLREQAAARHAEPKTIALVGRE